MSINEIWKRIEAWFVANATELSEQFKLSGATETEIIAVEELLGFEFPKDFRESLRISSGTIPLDGAWELLGLNEIFDEWKVWNQLYQSGEFSDFQVEPHGAIKPYWWNPQWIPITYNGAGDHQCLDMDPAPGGRVGQVIQMWHDWEQRKVDADSFTMWLDDFASGLENGSYHIVNGYLE